MGVNRSLSERTRVKLAAPPLRGALAVHLRAEDEATTWARPKTPAPATHDTMRNA